MEHSCYWGKDMKLSVIVPTYNCEKYVKECLNSIVCQKDIEFELICVDDNSTDRTYDILKEYKERYPDIISIYQIEHKGVSGARNYGLRKALGKYIYYVDSDDILVAGSLKYMYDMCENNNLDVFFFSFENFTDEEDMKKQYSAMLNKHNKRTFYTQEVITGQNLFVSFLKHNEYYVTVWCQCINRAYALKNNLIFQEGMVFEDQVYTFQVLEHARRTMCTNKSLYKKRIRSNSICTNTDKRDYFVGNLNTIFFLNSWLKTAEKNEYAETVYQLMVESKYRVYKKLSAYESNRFRYYVGVIFSQIEEVLIAEKLQVPLLSLCIPTSGYKKWILPVLDSIYANKISTSLYEIVVTNNGDRDAQFDTAIGAYRDLYGNFHYARNSAGMFCNEIEAYKAATGEMIKFINHRTWLDSCALKYYLICAYLLKEIKPVIYFSNGMLNNCNVQCYDSFDEFMKKIGYWSSWSTGMCLWRKEFELYQNEEFDSLFPHTNILFHFSSGKLYIVDNRELLYELPVGSGKKGKYDVFWAFAVRYVELYKELALQKKITLKTFEILKENLLEYIAFMYRGYVLYGKKTSYDISGYAKAIDVYYNDEEVKKINDQYPIKEQKEIQCRVVTIDIIHDDWQVCLSWKKHRSTLIKKDKVRCDLLKKLRKKYKFVEENIIAINDKKENNFNKLNFLQAYLDETVDFVIINNVSQNLVIAEWVRENAKKFSKNVIILES